MHARLNLPMPQVTSEGLVDPKLLIHLIRVLNDWSRSLDTQVDATEHAVTLLSKGGGIGT